MTGIIVSSQPNSAGIAQAVLHMQTLCCPAGACCARRCPASASAAPTASRCSTPAACAGPTTARPPARPAPFASWSPCCCQWRPKLSPQVPGEPRPLALRLWAGPMRGPVPQAATARADAPCIPLRRTRTATACAWRPASWTGRRLLRSCRPSHSPLHPCSTTVRCAALSRRSVSAAAALTSSTLACECAGQLLLWHAHSGLVHEPFQNSGTTVLFEWLLICSARCLTALFAVAGLPSWQHSQVCHVMRG